MDDELYSANFVQVAVNVVRKDRQEENLLPAILRRWFGPDAGAAGTRHEVALEQTPAGWQMKPIGRRRGELERWRSYSREEIPRLFGFDFSTAIWNVGFVKRAGHMFLLVTLDKSGHADGFQYKDHFVDASLFEWQSQNRTSQAGQDGRDIRDHVTRGIAVHLFVRDQKKQPRGGAAPFTYCGDVTFDRWEGERPITVWWRLSEPVPRTLWENLQVPPLKDSEP